MKETGGITIYGERISPLFDTAERILALTLEGNRITETRELIFPRGTLETRTAFLSESGVKLLFCGAISRPARMLIESRGILVYPFLSGFYRDLLSVIEKRDFPELLTFSMPGRIEANRNCGRFRHRRRGQQYF